MIETAKLRAAMAEMATAISGTIIRADQPGKKPPYPYAAYKIISSQEEHGYQAYRESTSGADPDLAYNKRTTQSRATVSLTFLDQNKTADIEELAQRAMTYLRSQDSRDNFYTQDMRAQLISPSVEDRTTYLEAYNENRYGFDFRVVQARTETEEIESVNVVQITPKPENVAQSPITISGV